VLKKLIGILVFLGLVGLALWQFSPWPSALFYRHLFDKTGVAMNDALAKHVPVGVTVRRDIGYGPDAIEKLDVYVPSGIEGSDRMLPTIFWVHGGGFLSGDKNQVSNYLRIISAAGYAGVGINYTLAPSAQHPKPTQQANAALAFIKANAAKLNVDADRVILAGDSAGAQIAAQLGIAISEPNFARSLDITPAIPSSALRGLLLHCGIYDPDSFKMSVYRKTVNWSYLGTKELRGSAMPKQFSIVRNITQKMPPMFITAGNADPLLPHSKTLADTARNIGVTVDTLFFPDDHSPPLQHEYEFDLDTAAGQLALRRSLAFIAERTQ